MNDFEGIFSRAKHCTERQIHLYMTPRILSFDTSQSMEGRIVVEIS